MPDRLPQMRAELQDEDIGQRFELRRILAEIDAESGEMVHTTLGHSQIQKLLRSKLLRDDPDDQ